MTLYHKRREVYEKRQLSHRDIHGLIGSIAVTMFGGPRMLGVSLEPPHTVRIYATYDTNLEGTILSCNDINESPICKKLEIQYQAPYTYTRFDKLE